MAVLGSVDRCLALGEWPQSVHDFVHDVRSIQPSTSAKIDDYVRFHELFFERWDAETIRFMINYKPPKNFEVEDFGDGKNLNKFMLYYFDRSRPYGEEEVTITRKVALFVVKNNLRISNVFLKIIQKLDANLRVFILTVLGHIRLTLADLVECPKLKMILQSTLQESSTECEHVLDDIDFLEPSKKDVYEYSMFDYIKHLKFGSTVLTQPETFRYYKNEFGRSSNYMLRALSDTVIKTVEKFIIDPEDDWLEPEELHCLWILMVIRCSIQDAFLIKCNKLALLNEGVVHAHGELLRSLGESKFSKDHNDDDAGADDDAAGAAYDAAGAGDDAAGAGDDADADLDSTAVSVESVSKYVTSATASDEAAKLHEAADTLKKITAILNELTTA
jgi:hypothetical protein